MLSAIEIGFLQRAVDLSSIGMRGGGGGPFGCVVVKDNLIIGEGYNMVTATNDPTAHAEMVAIRKACGHINHHQLTGSVIYSSCEPCPMCMGAIYWARPAKLIFANTRHDAANVGFDDDFIYREMDAPLVLRAIPFINYSMQAALDVFEEWKNKTDKIDY